MRQAAMFLAEARSAGGAAPERLTRLVAGFDLLSSQPAQTDAVSQIVEAVDNGELTEKTLAAVEQKAAAAHAAVEFRGQLRQRSEHLFVQRFGGALVDGGADAILDSLRPEFDEAAAALHAAMEIVDVNASAEFLAEHATPEETAAWRSLKPNVMRLDKIAAIARQFGPKSITFGVLDVPFGVEFHGVDDEALLCTEGDVLQASAAFRARRADVRTAPWLRTTPKLLTIDEAKERLRAWAEHAWNITHSDRGKGVIDPERGFIQQKTRNPHAKVETAEAK
jgi:hypothetical protein